MEKISSSKLWTTFIIGIFFTLFGCGNGKTSFGSSESTTGNVCEDTDNGRRMYREGVRSGNEDSQVYRDCQSYYDSFIKPQLSSSERGLIPESCFCNGYNSVPKSY